MRWLAVGVSVIWLLPAAAAQAPPGAPAGNIEAGKAAFTKSGCYECHGYEGQGAPWLAAPRIAPDPVPFQRFASYLRAPTGEMPPYSVKALSAEQLADIYAYLQARPRPPAVNTIPLLSAPASSPRASGSAATAPKFEVETGWLKVPAKWKLGDVSSVAVGPQDHVWILHRPRTLAPEALPNAAPPVLEFDASGAFIQGWGGAGKGYDWPEREHGIHVDDRGHVWIGGNNCAARNLPGLKAVTDDQLLEFTSNGMLVRQVGRPSSSDGNADTGNFHEPADAFLYRKTNEVFIADGYGNHRVVVLDALTGRFKRAWGAFGNTPVDSDACPPAQNTNPAQPGDDPGPQQFAIVHAARVSNDGLVYVADRENKRVQVFTIAGKFVSQAFLGGKIPNVLGRAGCLAFSPDAAQRFLYVSVDSRILVLDRKTLAILDSFGGANAHHIAVDSKGNLYTAETMQRRTQKFAYKGDR